MLGKIGYILLGIFMIVAVGALVCTAVYANNDDAKKWFDDTFKNEQETEDKEQTPEVDVPVEDEEDILSPTAKFNFDTLTLTIGG